MLMEAIGPRAMSVRYDVGSGRVHVDLAKGCELVFPARHEDALKDLPDTDLAGVEVSSCGRFLTWPNVGAQLCIAGFMAGELGMRAWLDRDRAARAGAVRSEAKARAARENGRKGGRPRLRPLENS